MTNHPYEINGDPMIPESPTVPDLKTAKRHFSRLGLGAFLILAAGTAAQVLAMMLADTFWPGWRDHTWGMWLVAFVPLYLIAFPLGILVLRTVPPARGEKKSVKPGHLALIAIISIFMMYAGNLLGVLLTTLIQRIFGIPAANPVVDLTSGTALLPRILFVVMLAPVLEELVFRKLLIDRISPYGEKLAVFLSALIFGLFHGNLSQLFYAFTLGLVFGYLYLKTRKLRYSIGLHVFINFLGGVAAPALLEALPLTEDLTALTTPEVARMLPALLGLLLYSFSLMGLAIAGLVILCINRKKITFSPAASELPKGAKFRTACLNVGMMLLIIGCMILIVTSIFTA